MWHTIRAREFKMKNLKGFPGPSAPLDYAIISKHIALLFEAVSPGDVVF